MRVFPIFLCLIFVGCVSSPKQPIRTEHSGGSESINAQEYKRVSFDKFFDGKIASMPLSFEIPSFYVHAAGAPESVGLDTYWMRTNEVENAILTKDLPVKTGYLCGRVTENMAFDKSTGKFTTEEDDYEAQASKAGGSLMEKKRFEVKGHPVFSFIFRDKNGVVICGMYVAMLIEDNVLFIVYHPPMNDLTTGCTVWNHIVTSLK
jgi:hypothetical protein